MLRQVARLAGNLPHLSADSLEALAQRIGQKFSFWYGPGSERTMERVNAIHYYTRPLYRINYLYSKLLALVYFDRFTTNRARFQPRFNELLANGYDATPDELLRRHIELELNDPRPVQQSMAVIDGRIKALELLYKP